MTTILTIMTKRKVILLPKPQKILLSLGENIKVARLRRKLSVVQVSERAGISRTTLRSIEHGSPTVAIGHYTNVLMVLGLEGNLAEVARDDILGRKLQDAKLITGKRAPQRK